MLGILKIKKKKGKKIKDKVESKKLLSGVFVQVIENACTEWNLMGELSNSLEIVPVSETQ